MNAISEITMTEEAARAGVAGAIAARSEAQKHCNAALSKHAEAQARLAEREEAFKQAHDSHQGAIDKGAADADIIRTLHKADEARALADAAKAASEKAAGHLDAARCEVEVAEADVTTAGGHVLAAIARKEVENFREVRKEMTRLGARLYALRGQCTNLRVPIPPCLLDKAIDATATDSTFPALYRHSRDGIIEFLDKLASDPQAPFDLKE